MADYSFGGTDEENAELKKLNSEVVSSSKLPDVWYEPLILCYSSARGPR